MAPRGQDWVDIEHVLDYGKVDAAEARSWLEQILGPYDARVARLRRLSGWAVGA
jgi:hypothetical protein